MNKQAEILALISAAITVAITVVILTTIAGCGTITYTPIDTTVTQKPVAPPTPPKPEGS